MQTSDQIMDKAMQAHAMGLIRPGEYWGGLLDYPGYLVGEAGEVISLVRKTPRKLAPVKYGEYQGYQMKRRDGTLRKEYVHRLVAEVFYGPCPPGMECRHLDGNDRNHHHQNLRWGTRLENAQDRVRHGTSAKGERNPQAVLTAEAVAELRAMRAATGMSHRKLGKRFGVSTMAAYRAQVGQSWAEVKS